MIIYRSPSLYWVLDTQQLGYKKTEKNIIKSFRFSKRKYIHSYNTFFISFFFFKDREKHCTFTQQSVQENEAFSKIHN